jgi:signal recognition particle receptor subunit beta
MDRNGKCRSCNFSRLVIDNSLLKYCFDDLPLQTIFSNQTDLSVFSLDMDMHKRAQVEENVDPEFLNESSEALPLTIIMSFLVVFTTIIILWWARNRRGSARRGECLLLCGVSNSGKTLLFSRLTMGLAKRTLTSMAVNRGSMVIENPSAERSSQKIHVIDIPGNLRIRQRDFNANKTSAKAIIFAIDSTTINEESKDVSDYLYDILREKTFRQQRLPLLIFCNKQDINSDNETIQSIRHLLENELTMKRKTRASSVAVHQGKGESNDDIGRAGKDTFEFNDIKDIQIEFIDGSALGTEKKAYAKHYDDEEDIDSAGSETDVDGGADLHKVYDWIEKIWIK